MPQPDQIELRYRAYGGRPEVDLSLHLSADGTATAFVGTSRSIPLGRVTRVGRFGGTAPGEELDAIRAYLADHDLVARAGEHGRSGPSTPTRTLELTVDGKSASLKLGDMSNGKELDRFEQLLQALALAMTEQPVAAIEATLVLPESDRGFIPTITLTALGDESLTVLFADPEQPVFTMYLQVELSGTKSAPNGVTFPAKFGTVAFDPDQVQQLAARGELPSGIAEVSAGAVYTFTLPPISVPDDATDVVATGSVDFWLPDGKSRRALNLLTKDHAIS